MPSERSAPMGEALAGVAEELRRLGILGERLQQDLSPLLRTASTVAAEAQGLDLIVQHAHDLAAYVERCSQACPPDWTIDRAETAAGLKLSDLAQRLGAAPFPATSERVDAGELELW